MFILKKGIDEQDKWEALERYMKDFSLLKEKEVPDLKNMGKLF